MSASSLRASRITPRQQSYSECRCSRSMHIVNSEPAPSRSWRSRLLLATAVIAVISGLIWFLFSAANMAGSLSDLADAENLWVAIRDTGFGNVWTARMLLAVLIVVAAAAYALRKASIGENLLVLILAAVFLASLAGGWPCPGRGGRSKRRARVFRCRAS